MRIDDAAFLETSDAWLRRFQADAFGVASIEFALILPILLLLYLGSFDLCKEITASRKLSLASGTVSSLVSALPTDAAVSSSTISGILAVSPLVMTPFSGLLTVTVSAIVLKPRSDGTCCNATVSWSYTKGGTLRPCGVYLSQAATGAAPSPGSIPQSLATQSSSTQSEIIIADMTYEFTPLGPVIDRFMPTTLQQTSYTMPRQYGQIALQNPVVTASGQTAIVCP